MSHDLIQAALDHLDVLQGELARPKHVFVVLLFLCNLIVFNQLQTLVQLQEVLTVTHLDLFEQFNI